MCVGVAGSSLITFDYGTRTKTSQVFFFSPKKHHNFQFVIKTDTFEVSMTAPSIRSTLVRKKQQRNPPKIIHCAHITLYLGS